MKRLALILVLLWSTIASAQHWNLTEDGDHLKCIVKIKCKNGMGTGFVVGKNKIITARHVSECELESVVFQGGITVPAKLIRNAAGGSDVSLVEAETPESVVIAKIATQAPRRGDYLEFAGLGGNASLKNIRHFWGTAGAPSCDHSVYAGEALIPGDSGGPVFNGKHEVVGVISGGWFWWGMTQGKSPGSKLPMTYPARAMGLKGIESALAKPEVIKIELKGM